MGIPSVIRLRGDNYYYYGATSDYAKLQKLIAKLKRDYKTKYYILKTPHYYGTYTIYNLYLNKVQ